MKTWWEQSKPLPDLSTRLLNEGNKTFGSGNLNYHYIVSNLTYLQKISEQIFEQINSKGFWRKLLIWMYSKPAFCTVRGQKRPCSPPETGERSLLFLQNPCEKSLGGNQKKTCCLEILCTMSTAWCWALKVQSCQNLFGHMPTNCKISGRGDFFDQ